MQLSQALLFAALTAIVAATGTTTTKPPSTTPPPATTTKPPTTTTKPPTTTTQPPTTTTSSTKPSFTPATCSPDGKACHDPFYIKCKNINGFSGYVQSQNDGQIFCGADNGLSGCGSDPKPYFYLLSNGGVLDSRARVAGISSANQLQFNPAPISSAQSGFALKTCDGKPALLFNGISTFYICGQNTGRVYTGTQVPQSDPTPNGCVALTLEVEYVL